MDILSKIKPSLREKFFIEKITNEFLDKLKRIKTINPIVGGSISKDTWLKGTNEVDIFAKFNYNKFRNKSDKISGILYKELKKLFKIKLVHGSRDYFHIYYKDILFEIVPILDIKKPEQAKNVTDLSPLHINIVKKFPKLKDEIRLLKAFCKSNLLYGAESYISGFSGYALEVLVIYYKSFKNTLKNSVKWEPKIVVDFNKKLKNPLLELNPSKTVSPLIIIDPVDNTRNITSSLSMENFNKFIKLAKLYLKNPSEKFFGKKTKIPKNSLVLEIVPLNGKKDVVGSKIVKLINFIKNESNKFGFKISQNSWSWDKEVLVWYKVKNKKISNYFIHKGPPEDNIENVKKFKQKYKNVFVKNKIYYTKIKRDVTNINDFIKNLIKDKYIKERAKEIKIQRFL